MANWTLISTEYITTDISLRDLAKKHTVSFSTLRARAKKENWVAQRTEQCHKVSTELLQKTTDVLVCATANRIERISSIADKLVDKLEQAVEELDSSITTRKKKTKTIEYDAQLKGKVAKEVTTEEEFLDIIQMQIDRSGVKQLASALKDLRDIQMGVSASDDNGILNDIAKYFEGDEGDNNV